MDYLIAGCAGFLGTSISKKLLNEGHSVLGIDNFVSGIQKNIDILSSLKNFTFLRADIMDNEVFESIALKPDVVINLATAASPKIYQRIPIQTLLSCVVGTHNLLQFSQKSEAKFIQASTSEIYGNPLVSPIPETYTGNVNIQGPRGCYDVGKQAAETICADFHRLHNTVIQIPRIFNTYGIYKNLNDGRVIPTFIRQALANEPITVSGDGGQVRSFMHVDDFLDVFTKLIEADEFLGAINIGNPEAVTINHLAERIQVISGSKSKIVFQAQPIDDPVIRIPDITKVRLLLGWNPKISLDQGLEQLIAHFNAARC
jgi:UDP-glucuronate decarboxylase